MKLLISGGGTGGHLYPGIAVAQEFLSRSADNDVLFVGTRRGLEARIIPKLKYPIEYISIQGWTGKAWFSRIKTLLVLPVAFVQSIRIILKYKPDFVLGVGGYASFPMLLAAFILRKKSGIQEQNLIPGYANRVLSRIVQKIFLSFEQSDRFFPAKTIVTGNPVRKFEKIEPVKQDRFTIFVFGGSQGAHSLNRGVLEALPLLADMKDHIHFIHQTGRKDLHWVESSYFQVQWKADVYAFIDKMEEVYAKADFVICRAGAASLVELSLLKKACLLIPYPHAAHNHQEEHAKLLEKKDAARVLMDWQLDGQRLEKEIRWAYLNPRELDKMKQNILQFSHPYAAKSIVDNLN